MGGDGDGKRPWRIAGDRSNEPVASAGHGFDESGIVGFFAEGTSQFSDGGVQSVVELDEGVGGPKSLTNLFSGNQFAGALEQHGEDLERLFLQPDSQSVFGQDELFKINFKPSKFNHVVLWWRDFHSHCPCYFAEGFDSREFR